MKPDEPLAHELSAELLNERLDGYRVLREVGHGAMASSSKPANSG